MPADSLWSGPLVRRALSRLTFTQTSCGAKDGSLASWRTHAAGQLLPLAVVGWRKARRLAEDSGHARVQTTPHMLSWLIFKGRLGDSDKGTLIDQHRAMDRPLAPHFEAAYEMALQCRLNARQSAQ